MNGQTTSLTDAAYLAFDQTMFYFLNVVVTLSSITWVGGWRFMIAALLLAGLYKRAASLYSPLSRDLRRLDSLNRSPLYATFSEAIAGIQTIRAYGTSGTMMEKMTKIVSNSHCADVRT
jgi:ABC-type multidrug transport system fused ATPase/permease subunit